MTEMLLSSNERIPRIASLLNVDMVHKVSWVDEKLGKVSNHRLHVASRHVNRSQHVIEPVRLAVRRHDRLEKQQSK